MMHILKVETEYFEALNNWSKNFELRICDRDYKVGDEVEFFEINEDGKKTGRCLSKRITYIFKDCPEYGLKDGYCILGLNNTIPEHIVGITTMKLRSIRDEWKENGCISDIERPITPLEAFDTAIALLENMLNKDSCVNCAFSTTNDWEMPCKQCKRGCKDYYRPAPNS